MHGAPHYPLTTAGRLLNAALALSVLVAVIGGLPWLLVTFAGWPLPGHVPARDELVAFLGSPITDQVILDVLVCACWIAWAAFTLETASATAALVGQVRARTASSPVRRDPGMVRGRHVGGGRPLGRLAAGLVGAIVLAAVPARHSADLQFTTDAATGALQLGDGDTAGLAAAGNARAHTGPIGTEPRSTADRAARAFTAATTAQRRARQITVRPPRGRMHDSLWRIAERELGNPRRWPEIYDLNAGRPQPDGGRLEDPDLIHPGWILLLPETPAARAAEPRPGAPDATAPTPTANPAPPQAPPATPDRTPTPSTAAATENPTATPGRAGERPAGTTPPSPAATPAGNLPTGHPAQDATTAPAPASRGVELPTGGYVGLGLAAAVSVLLALARIRHRRRDDLTGGGTFRLPLEAPTGEPPPAVVQALRRAHLHTAQPAASPRPEPPADDAFADGSSHPPGPSDPDSWAVRTTMTAAPPDSASALWVPLGTARTGKEIGLDLLHSGGLGLDGPGALGVARAVIADVLTHTARGTHVPRARVVTPRADAERLLGPLSTHPAPPGITIVDGLDDALDAGLAPSGGGTPALLVLTPASTTRERLAREAVQPGGHSPRRRHPAAALARTREPHRRRRWPRRHCRCA